MPHAGLRTVAERNIAEACAANIRRFRQNKFRRVNHSSLSELFISFLAKVIISVMLSTLMKNLGCRHLYGVYQISRYIWPEYATNTIYLDYEFFFLNVDYVPDVYILGKCPFLIIVCWSCLVSSQYLKGWLLWHHMLFLMLLIRDFFFFSFFLFFWGGAVF